MIRSPAFAARLAALGILLPLLSATARAQQASAPDQRLTQLERENAELRARMDAIAREVSQLRAAPSAGSDARIEALERENAELRRRIDVLAGEVERVEVGDAVLPVQGSEYGLGPAASKVYQRDQGLSIGGYGEAIYENVQGRDSDEFDALRTVLYLGYKFDDRWVFNSEIEFEHAGEEVGVEFAYLDYLHSDALNARAGLVLVPMGFLNELHEPTTFFSTHRPQTERLILPSTWRENGVGIFGDAGDFSYRTYVVNGFDASGFTAGGLRGGRQNGSEALAEDFAWTGRLDWTGTDGLVAGASAYWGEAGQDQGLPDATTTIVDLHAEYSIGGWRARALWAHAEVDDVEDLNGALGLTGADSIGEELEGWYAELGYDVLSSRDADSQASLTPFVRYEAYDTQKEVPGGFSSDPANDVEIITFGVAWQPHRQIVFKADYQDVENDADDAADLLSLGLGFVF